MNLLLHGLDAPQIDHGNALRSKLTDIGERDSVDVILTNPPFGGEEERGIQGNFPEDKQTAETALLFLQLIMRKLHRVPSKVRKPARAAVVAPNGTLFGDGVCARIKEALLDDFELHTILRLPAGVFAPYTDQETAILFFDRTGKSSKDIWYYQHPLPTDRAKLKNPCYRKSCPIRFEEFAPLLKWWFAREETDCAWKVAADLLRQNNFNFDLRHPSQSGGAVIRTRSEVSQGIELASSELAKSASQLLEALKLSGTALPPTINPPCKTIQELGIGLNSENRNPEKSPAEEFIYVDLSSVDHNVIESLKRIKGSEAPSRARRVIRENDVILSTVRPYLGGHAVVPETLDNQICSTRFSVLRCPDHVNPTFLYFMLISPQVVAQFHSCMRGSHYPALNDDHVRNLLIPDLSRDKQDEIVGKLENLIEQIEASVTRIEAFSQLLNGEANAALSSLLADAYGTFAEKEKRGEY